MPHVHTPPIYGSLVCIHVCIFVCFRHACIMVYTVLPQLHPFKHNLEKSIIYYTSVLLPCKYHHLFFNELLD